MEDPGKATWSAASAARYYIEGLGWGLVPIEPGTKGPKRKGWNRLGGFYTEPDAAEQYWRKNPTWGLGLVHQPSGTAALDIDHLEYSLLAFRAVGHDLDRLLCQGLGIVGNPDNKAKALFKLPQGMVLEPRALCWPSPRAGEKPVKVFELRAGPVQDVLPPSIHPGTGRPYRWITPPWEVEGIPELPAGLVELWQRWDEHRPHLEGACPWGPQSRAEYPAHGGPQEWDELRRELRSRVSLEEMLARLHAERRGNHYLCPFHPEKNPSFWLFDTGEGYLKWFCSHGGAPVGHDTPTGGSCGDVIDLYQFLRGLGGAGEATRELAQEMGLEMPGNGKSARGTSRGELAAGEADAVAWPDPPDEAAFHGLAGEIVRAIEPHTEADPAALLVQILVAFGNVIRRGPHFVAEADRHALNLFAVLVGMSAKGRKGSSWGHVRRVLTNVEEEWASQRVQSGLSSGEGLIWAVRDALMKTEPIKEKGKATGEYQKIMVDPGISDKRLLVMEAEFASTLRVLGREGNTLSAVIRQAWDTGTLRALTKNSPAQATGAHISIIGHITREELTTYLSSTEAGNGFGNRFLWVCVKRSKCLPEGGRIEEAGFAPLVQQLHEARVFADAVGEIRRDPEARSIWFEVYPDLSAGKAGLFGAVTSRAEAQVMRLACLYALLDQSSVVRKEHLLAALALWEYCEASACFIFGDTLGDPTADEILKAMREAPQGLTRTEIRDLFGRNKEAREITQALSALLGAGLVHKVMEQSKGRPAERWFALRASTTKTT